MNDTKINAPPAIALNQPELNLIKALMPRVESGKEAAAILDTVFSSIRIRAAADPNWQYSLNGTFLTPTSPIPQVTNADLSPEIRSAE